MPNPLGAYTAKAGSRGGRAISTTSKSISHGTTNQVYSLSTEVSDSAVSSELPSRIEVSNVGQIPLNVLAGFETWSSATVETGVTRYLHVMLMPKETWTPPVRGLISTEAASTQFTGTELSNQAPDSNEYTDSGIDTNDDGTPAAGIIGSDTDTTIYMTPFTSSTNNSVNMFRVGDLIRINNEIMEVTAVGSGADADNDYLTVIRGVYGSTAVDTHADATDVRFPFFNAYHDFDKFSVAQTDSQGRFKCFNFFGNGRASSGVSGIVPGSIALKFYTAGYQELGLSGITSSTNTSLTAGGSYWFKIAIDGGTAEAINFTVDSSNTNWGGTSGVISLINAALTDKYNNSASNTFQQKSSVGIVNGDVRFTSGSHLSTSAITLAAGTDGASASYNIFAQQNGWFPALANIDAAVPARLPDDVVYNRVTYATSTNPVFSYDDGFGNIYGMCNGTINYETGAIDITGCPPNAEFVYSVGHKSAFSGKLDTGANALIEILANNPNSKRSGKLEVKVY